jgi:DNA-binding transcriptional LysR family regulator
MAMYVAYASLQDGKVVEVLSEFELPSQEIHAVYPSRRLVNPRVTALVEYLSQAFAPADWYARTASI